VTSFVRFAEPLCPLREEYTVLAITVDRVRELLHEGNVTRVIVKMKQENLLEIPAA
jgi:hypothetical protein